MIGLTSLEVCNLFFNVTETNIKFKLYHDFNGRFSWHTVEHNERHWSLTHIESEVLDEDVIDEMEKVLVVLDRSDEGLQDETTGPLHNTKYQKLIKHLVFGIIFGGYV